MTTKDFGLGCGKKLRNFDGKQVETNNPDFICGVPDGWGQEKLCRRCDFKMRAKWKTEDIKFYQERIKKFPHEKEMWSIKIKRLKNLV